MHTIGRGGAGTSAGPAAQITWGPDFGDASDWEQESELTALAHLPIYTLEQESQITSYLNQASYPMSEESELTRYELDQTYPMVQESAVAVAQVPSYQLIQESQVTDYAQAPVYGMVAESCVGPMTAVPTYAPVAESEITVAEHNVSAIIAAKDVYASTVQIAGMCVDTVNHNGENMLVDQDRRAFIGFDLSGFAPATTVLAATLHLTKASVATAAASSVSIHAIDSANEGWTEGTLVCSNAPPPAVASTQVVLSTSTGSTDVVLQAFEFYLTNRIGTTRTATFRIQVDIANPGSSATLYSKEVDITKAPRLSFTYRQ